MPNQTDEVVRITPVQVLGLEITYKKNDAPFTSTPVSHVNALAFMIGDKLQLFNLEPITTPDWVQEEVRKHVKAQKPLKEPSHVEQKSV